MMAETVPPAASDANVGAPLKRIVLRLALNPGPRHAVKAPPEGYVLVAPVDEAGFLEFPEGKGGRWPVRRFDGAAGVLRHHGAFWYVDYDEDVSSDDEAFFRLSDHRLLVGDYVSLSSLGGEVLTYRVTEVAPATAEGGTGIAP